MLSEQGYLIKKGYIASVGELDYLGSELGINDRPNEIFKVHQTKEELFSPETIASFEGMPVTLLHPDDMEVTASDWKEKSVGHIQNVKPEGDRLTCNVYVQDAAAIQVVNDHGIEELSCGTDTVLDSRAGKIVKTKIKGNHVAIVPYGRCGSSCKLGDEGIQMKVKEKIKLTDSLASVLNKLKGVKVGDSAEDVKQGAEQAQTAITEAVNAVQEAASVVAEVQTEAEKVETIEGVTPEQIAEKDNRIAELEAENEQLKTKVSELEQQLSDRDASDATTTAINDAAIRFPKLKLNDAKSARDVYTTVLVDAGAFTKESAEKLTDSEIKAAYHAYAATARKPTSNLGKALLGDSKPQPKKSAAQRLGGK